MKNLNEQLAELCGAEIGERTVWSFSGERNQLKTYTIKNKQYDEPNWNPTQDLNQLRMCYEAAEKVVGQDAFARAFAWAFCDLFKEATGEIAGMFDIATAWVKHPELVAQAILKAKGVS